MGRKRMPPGRLARRASRMCSARRAVSWRLRLETVISRALRNLWFGEWVIAASFLEMRLSGLLLGLPAGSGHGWSREDRPQYRSGTQSSTYLPQVFASKGCGVLPVYGEGHLCVADVRVFVWVRHGWFLSGDAVVWLRSKCVQLRRRSAS